MSNKKEWTPVCANAHSADQTDDGVLPGNMNAAYDGFELAGDTDNTVQLLGEYQVLAQVLRKE